MAKTPAPTVSRVLSTEPAPSVPYTQLNALSPDLSSFIRKLMVYLKDLTYQFGLLQRVNQISGPVTSSGGSSTFTTPYDVVPSIDDDHTSDESIATSGEAWGNIAWFGDGIYVPIGTYTITYINGALQYSGNTDPFRINLGPDNNCYKVCYNDGFSIINAPGSTTGYTTQSLCEAGESGASITIVHGGGKVGVRLFDSPRNDNFIDPLGSAPKFELSV